MSDEATATDAKTEEASTEEKAPEEAQPTPEERVVCAESAKDSGNALLKAGDFDGAVKMYGDGIGHSEPLLEKDPVEVGEEMQRRGATVYVALRLNSAQACIKLSDWVTAIEHANKVLVLDKDNAKALYRRGFSAVQLDSEGRLDEARTDFARLVQLEPSNREARELHQKATLRLKDLRQQEKERLSAAMKGGLYQDHHAKLGRLQAVHEEEVKRRKEAGEDEITFEEWTKKEKTRQEEHEKKQKEAAEKKVEELKREDEQRRWGEANAQRVAAGQAELSLEDWRAELAKDEQARRLQEVVNTDGMALDEEEKRLLQETKSKGYYHGRLGTVLSDAAPKPQQVVVDCSPISGASASSGSGSEWNQGTGFNAALADWWYLF
ncbi:unnamed protein product [Polarella glacialis]|uniref:peptidylprolyl isomerase n=1 Tax=Polarella glacialis TaxID=89957 RepID=A0A813K2C2_POLGL|nr:unnamed protein product [Polarella glacialis]